MYTVFGGKGFIGGNIVKRLKEDNKEIFIPAKNDESIYGKKLGNIIYCAGLTSDFRKRPYDTVEAHVNYLSKVLKHTCFDSFLYISSTRVYFDSAHGSEDVSLTVNPNNLDDIFNISKLMGESLCLNSGIEKVKIARVSNVCGEDFTSNNFLYSIIKDAVQKKEVVLHTTLDSEKDYIAIDDVVNIILKIADKGKSGIYNVAAGKNISNKDISNILKEVTNCTVRVSESAVTIKFPNIEIDKIKNEFDFIPCKSETLIRDLIHTYIQKRGR